MFSYGGSYSARLSGRIGQTLFDRGGASSYAAYGQGTLPIAEATSLTLGLRYTIEHRSVRANGDQLFDRPPFLRPIPGLPLLTEEPLRSSETFKELTWRASLDRHFSDEVMAYLSASRGFQSGGWNLQTPQNPPFAPERLDAFEAGLKYLDGSRRFRGEASLFYYDYSDLQVSAVTPLGAATTNATSAEVYGLALQVAAELAHDTDVTLGLQALQSRFNLFPTAFCIDYRTDAVVPYLPIACDVTGNRLPYAPELIFTLGVSHQVSLGRFGTLLLGGNLAYNSGYFAEPDNVVRQQAYAVVDLSAEWRPNGRAPSVRLWVLNLTDSQYYNSLAAVATAGVLQSPAAPRRFGASIGYDF